MSQFKINQQDDGMPDFEELQRLGDMAERKESEEGSPSSQPHSEEKENKRSLNYLYLPTWLWKWLVEASNSQGMKLERFVVMLIKEANRNWKEPIESDVETYVAWARQRSDASSEAYEDAYAIAVNCKNHPTEENTRLLFVTCEKLGIDPDELIQKASADAYAEIVTQYKSDPDSKMNRAVKWVIDFCRDKNEIPSRVFNEAGEKAGFTRQMLHSARRKCGIKSILRGGEYYLVVPKATRVLHGKVFEE